MKRSKRRIRKRKLPYFHSNLVSLGIILVVLFVVPITLLLSTQHQIINQQATTMACAVNTVLPNNGCPAGYRCQSRGREQGICVKNPFYCAGSQTCTGSTTPSLSQVPSISLLPTSLISASPSRMPSTTPGIPPHPSKGHKGNKGKGQLIHWFAQLIMPLRKLLGL